MSHKSILLVDDEEAILTAVGWSLEQNNFQVTTAASGGEALNLLRARPYDLVITDLLMARVDGVAVLKLAKALYPEIGVIILTGYGDVSSAVQTLQLGADDYLQKPCDIDELLSKARRNFEKQDLVVRLRNQNERLKKEMAARKDIERQLQESLASLEQKVAERTAELSHKVEELTAAMAAVQEKEKQLQEKNRDLQDMNTTLTTLMKRREQEHDDIRKEIAEKTTEMVVPLLKKAQVKATGSTREYVKTAQANLLDVLARQAPDIALANARLAPRELQVVHYVRQDKTSKEIADLLDLSVRTVESYRENIREKLRIKNKKKNLRKFLTSLP